MDRNSPSLKSTFGPIFGGSLPAYKHSPTLMENVRIKPYHYVGCFISLIYVGIGGIKFVVNSHQQWSSFQLSMQDETWAKNI